VSSSNPAAPEPTEIAGRYQIVKKLGAGAFGTVYKARDARLDRMVAIKTIRLEGLAASQAGLKEMTDRFLREAKTAAKLKHPGIVTIHDYGDAEGLTYIVMEFIDGIGIDHILAETGRMPIERAAALGAQIAEALDYAHKGGVVHRDIKPANIMIEPGDRVKVTDFGIAKPGDSAEHLTMTGSLLGTPSYMSPEQARGQKLDGRSDLFSVGCVLYEMVAGKKAFRGESITALLFKIISEEPPSLREFDPKVPDEMLRIISKALQKSPDARYQTGRELAE
jgi:serine/threonine-protein kinase